MAALSRSLAMGPNMATPGSIILKSQLFGKPTPHRTDPNLSGRVAIVTGASTGIGLHSCHQLLSFQLSHLIMAVRSVHKGDVAATRLRQQFPSAKIDVWTLEMSSYESIQEFVRRVETNLTRLDIAILNAAVVKQEYGVVERTGHEEVFQVNYLSTVLLSILLLPALKTKSLSSTPGRLTIVGSGTAYIAKFQNRDQVPLLESFDNDTKWDPSQQYPNSKLLGHCFLAKLVNFVDPKDVIVNIVDPGFTKGSGLYRDVSGLIGVIYALAKVAVARTPEMAATTYVDAAVVKGAESHGCFVMDWKICSFAPFLYAPDSAVVIERLWNETMDELDFAQPLKILEGMKH